MDKVTNTIALYSTNYGQNRFPTRFLVCSIGPMGDRAEFKELRIGNAYMYVLAFSRVYGQVVRSARHSHSALMKRWRT